MKSNIVFIRIIVTIVSLGVSCAFAEAAAQLEAVRSICYNALWLQDRRLSHTMEPTMVKSMALRLAVEVVHKRLVLHGHAGYSNDVPSVIPSISYLTGEAIVDLNSGGAHGPTSHLQGCLGGLFGDEPAMGIRGTQGGHGGHGFV